MSKFASSSAAALLCAFAAMSLAAEGGRSQAQPVNTSLKAVVDAAATYVAAYEKDLSFVLADEIAAQRVVDKGGAELEKRTTRAEVFLTYLAPERIWIAVRDVLEADGVLVNDPDNVRSLMQRAPLGRLARTIADKNSRFNIGDVKRTFNEPTFALQVVSAEQRARFKFERLAVGDGPSPIVTVGFTEKDRPTLIRGLTGQHVAMRGELMVDAATGRVEKTRMEVTLGSVHAEITTTYARDARLDLWVPSAMSERYEKKGGLRHETISVSAHYTNYRRFDTRAIIK